MLEFLFISGLAEIHAGRVRLSDRGRITLDRLRWRRKIGQF